MKLKNVLEHLFTLFMIQVGHLMLLFIECSIEMGMLLWNAGTILLGIYIAGVVAVALRWAFFLMIELVYYAVYGIEYPINELGHLIGKIESDLSFGIHHGSAFHLTPYDILTNKYKDIEAIPHICHHYETGWSVLRLFIGAATNKYICPVTRRFYFNSWLYYMSDSLWGWLHDNADPNGNNCRSPRDHEWCAWTGIGYLLMWAVIVTFIVLFIYKYWPCIKLIIHWIFNVIHAVLLLLVLAFHVLSAKTKKKVEYYYNIFLIHLSKL